MVRKKDRGRVYHYIRYRHRRLTMQGLKYLDCYQRIKEGVVN